MNKQLDGRGGSWYRIPAIFDVEDEQLIRTWLQPFYDARRDEPEFYAKLICRLLVEDYRTLYEHFCKIRYEV